ncbi:MAG: FtsX-like permease family protein [Saprospiraceae bacterium]
MLILSIACVNYVNLATAQSAGRTAEISMRKILGAGRKQIFNQFIGESFFITAFALILAVWTSWLLLPFFNNLSGKQFQSTDLFNPLVLALLVLLGFVVSFIAGLYPAVILSGKKISQILKSGFAFSSGGNVRKSLIVFEFIVSIFLVANPIKSLRNE